jgi:rubredoxin---NAD+ reductase
MIGTPAPRECTVCGWVFDETVGDTDAGISPGTRWEELPDDWVCPVCDAGKEDFETIEAATPEGEAVSAIPPVVIVGSGLAGYTLARELRMRSADVPITIVTADDGEIYTKPMLSNALAKGQAPADLVQKEAIAFAADLDIEIRTRCRVRSIDRAGRSLNLETGDSLSYDRLVLALGADPRVFPAEGSEAVDIATVNDLDGYRAWRARIDRGGRILLVGAGLIGCEFANDLAGAGFKVAVVDPSPWPLARLLPGDMGSMLTRALEALGIAFHMGRTVSRYDAAGSDFTAILDDGTTIPFDFALSAVGLTPRTGLAAEAGLDVRAGIVVDRLLRTSDPAIYAIGDCAETENGPLPFIAPLLAEARALAATLTGDETPLHLPALPVIVKTPALPLVVCPPRPGAEGDWIVDRTDEGAVAVFRTPDGAETGFALAGATIDQRREMAERMPDLLPLERAGKAETEASAGRTWECDTCGWTYDPREADPEGDIAPGTAWEDIPDDWACPVCGAGKDEFTKAA